MCIKLDLGKICRKFLPYSVFSIQDEIYIIFKKIV